jgi:uncharacterized protein YidB (DUF937 family)
MKIELVMTITPEGQIPFTGACELDSKQIKSRFSVLKNGVDADPELKALIAKDVIMGICQELANNAGQMTNSAIQQIGNQLVSFVQQMTIPETLPEPVPNNPELKIGGE